MRSKRLSLILFCAFVALTANFVAGRAVAQEATPPATKNEPGLSDVLTDLLHGVEGNNTAGPDKRVPFGREEVQLSFAPLVKQTAPAVVNVYASQTAKVTSPFDGDPFFEEFFGRSMPRAQSSLGSGVLVDPTGVIVTNYHVIKGADEVKVALADGREFTSKVMLKDESLDLAVLKIEGDKPFPVIAIGDSDALEVGDLVLAIGNPFGVGQTTTSGIVSALARSHIGISDSGYFIQTDAAINPGNSGGALINMGGQLVGINTAIYSRSGGSIGIGFAIPANMVRAFAEAAKSGSDFFERPYIGAEFEAVTPQIAESLGMQKATGALVSSVADGGPAAKAGLKPGDVVQTLNGTVVEGIEALDYRMATLSIGSNATFGVLTKGQQQQIAIALERAPEGLKTAELMLRGRSPFAGARVADLSPRLAQRLGIRTDVKGVAVVDIERTSPAADFGFQPGDIVREVNGVTIDSAKKLEEAALQNTRWWRFTVERGGQTLRQVLRY
ncbi:MULTISPECIES: DegQ family serine endoprotease [Phyllobacteriaceae]|jgi:Do/DeqQ family serine protease|uniref:Serine protease n=1 Tax=Mesorhizobium hungaricum TaxID=1566387 RepID=A0A1C2DK74_9HYPH|nr:MULTISPECIES: DegQ family serine endoprotease [Mesorhizobium]MBN9235418.1 DegQ family serine endoprotease [Mesorhizobium sp.]MDQ0332659.1 Do/DeqQ family serine protease [Mesorhizobium sp. YL-MeA3-2017]OCX15086.1 serine protease [Mesorhizobium hungaricum]